MGKLGQIFVLFQLTVSLALAAVAYERCFHQIRAGTRILGSGWYDLNMLLDFLGYGRRVFADAPGDSFERYAVEQAILYLDTIFKSQVLTGCCGLP